MATNFTLKPFRFNIVDLNFIKDQINFRPLFDAAGNALINWNGVGPAYDAHGNLLDTSGSPDANKLNYGTSYNSLTDLRGLRDVSGLHNNLLAVYQNQGAVDQPFLQTVAPNFAGYVKPLSADDLNAYYAGKAFNLSPSTQATLDAQNLVGGPDYTKTATLPGGLQVTGDIVDYTPRMISQLVTTGGSKPLLDANGQVVHWNEAQYAAGGLPGASVADAAYKALIDTVSPGGAGLIEGATVIKDLGILAGGQFDPQDPTNHEQFFGAINPGVAPGNSFLAYFGQFFDHGLDFIGKGGGAVPSKITIPLATDDPLYRAPNTLFPGDPGNTKITVSRADISGFDANGNAQWVNHTSPYIDQSQTYGSHAQMTALLREWVSTDNGATYHAGAHLLDGATSKAWVNAW
ncbi:MAG: peroxidase family protein, partial [Methylotenera sp.]